MIKPTKNIKRGSESVIKNQRVATRCVRPDISAYLSDLGLFSFGKAISVKLLDITSKGVLIATDKKLKVNQKLTLTLCFHSGKTFTIKASIVRIAPLSRYEYGIKFDRYNNELGDHLLTTQSQLVFK